MVEGPVAGCSIERTGIKGRPVQLGNKELKQVQGERTLKRVRMVQIIQSFVGLVKTFKLSSRSVARRITCSYLHFEMAALQKKD